MVEVMDMVMSGTGDLWFFIQIIGLLIIVILITFFVLFIVKFKHKVRVREVIGGKTLISDDRARELVDNEGVTKWKLFKRKHCIPPPPAEAIHLTNKGKKSVEVYYLPEGEYKYVLDNGVNEDDLTNFEPLDTADREFYASEMREAETYKQKSWKDYILPIAGIMSILVIFILLLVFWEDVAKPGIKITEVAAGISEQQHETTKILRDIIQNRQTVEDSNIIFPEKNQTG